MKTYLYRYNRIIHYFKHTRPLSKKICPNSEYHHIVPKSCGGTDDEENIVLLPTKWHYIVHCWLPAVYAEQGKSKEYEKMLYAWKRMDNSGKDLSLKDIKSGAILYSKLRQGFSTFIGKMTSTFQSGYGNSGYGKHWWKDPNDRTKSKRIKNGDPVPNGWVKGKWINKEIIVNDAGDRRYISLGDPIPKGWIPLKDKKLKCKYCGAVIGTCKRPDICKRHQLLEKMFMYFDFDQSSLGSERFIEEFEKTKEKIKMQFLQSKTLDGFAKSINYHHGGKNIWHFLKSLFGEIPS